MVVDFLGELIDGYPSAVAMLWRKVRADLELWPALLLAVVVGFPFTGVVVVLAGVIAAETLAHAGLAMGMGGFVALQGLMIADAARR